MRKNSAMAALLTFAVLATPASAHHKPGHAGGPPHAGGVKVEKEQRGHESERRELGQGLRLGQLVKGGLDDGQVDRLADELRDCLDDGDDLGAMRRGQIKQLARAAGLSNRDVKTYLADDPDGLADELRERLTDEDRLAELKLGRVIQVAHSCGISTRELADLLDD